MAVMSSPTANSQRQTVQLPRALIFLASIWLIGSWMLTMGFRTPVHPSSASFTPGVRMMILSVVIGLMIGWPLLRLSQEATRLPIRQTLLDLVVLLREDMDDEESAFLDDQLLRDDPIVVDLLTS